jgi:hypothetical protein
VGARDAACARELPFVLPASNAVRARDRLGINWITWSKDQPDADPKVDIKIYSDLSSEDVTAFADLHVPARSTKVHRQSAAGSIGVGLWIDLADDETRRTEPVVAALTEAGEVVRRLATARCPAVEARLKGAIAAWIGAVAAGAKSEFEVTLLASANVEAAAVATINQVERGSGEWEDLGASLMIVVGTDRFSIRVRPVGRGGHHGMVPRPNAPIDANVLLPVRVLKADANQIAADLAGFEARVTQALSHTGETDVPDVLVEAQVLLARRATLEERRYTVEKAHDRLTTGWRPDAFQVKTKPAEVLDELEQRLSELRSRMLDIPQLLLAAGSWRQAQRTETLSQIAAAFLPPTLVAGALGANLLPWADPTSAEALIGMLVLMAMSGLAAWLFVRWRLIGSGDGEPALAWRALLSVAIVLGTAAGVYCLLDGTSIRTDESGSASVRLAPVHRRAAKLLEAANGRPGGHASSSGICSMSIARRRPRTPRLKVRCAAVGLSR